MKHRTRWVCQKSTRKTPRWCSRVPIRHRRRVEMRRTPLELWWRLILLLWFVAAPSSLTYASVTICHKNLALDLLKNWPRSSPPTRFRTTEEHRIPKIFPKPNCRKTITRSELLPLEQILPNPDSNGGTTARVGVGVVEGSGREKFTCSELTKISCVLIFHRTHLTDHGAHQTMSPNDFDLVKIPRSRSLLGFESEPSSILEH